MKRILLYTIMCLFGLFSLNAQEAPQNLVATEVTQTSITLTWDAVEGAEDYYVYKDGQLWANTSGATTYTEEGLTPETAYCFNVSAADNYYNESELSEQVCAITESIELAENEIVIGTATTKYYSPFLTILGGGSWFEAIYKSEEIGKACTISELAFSYKDGNETSADINIYLAETTKDEYANPNDATAESALTLVYSGTAVTLCDEEWETFVLNAPFNYSGENNLVVVVTTANTGLANNWNCYSDANSVLIKDVALDSKKPVLKLTLGEENEEPETPVVILPYRLESIIGENSYNDLYYTYNEKGQVTQVNQGSYATLVEYNTDGTVAKTTYAFLWNGELDYSSNYTVTDYTYTEGVLTSYTETNNYGWREPETSEYTLTYNEDGTVAKVTIDISTYAYEYVDGKLVKETYSYYDQWAGDDVTEYIKEFEYDEYGNCVTETKYDAYNNPPVPLEGVDYFYDWNIPVDSVHVFAYPHEVLPTRAYLVAKALRYYYRENGETGEVTKDNFEVKTYNYNEEVANFPLPPVNLAANVLSDTEVELTWETLEAAEYYNVRCNDELIAETTETSYTVENLTAGTEYCFTVTIIKSVAVDERAESYPSNEACATTYNLVNAVPNEVAFGNVVVGDYWSEKTSKVEIEINRFGKDVNQIKTDNSFFRLPASINYTDDPIKLTVNYKKDSEAGEYTGNLLVMVDSCYTVSIPLSATAYNPVAPDVFELAQEIEFVEGAYTDAPDFAALTDDYNLPNEAEGNNPDAVYSFTLAEEASVEINVESDSYDGIYAVYKAAFEGNGPSTDNNVEPTEKVLNTAFAYDFEDGSLEDFEIIDNDQYKDYTWKVENGSLISWDYIYDNENYTYIVDWADERIVTKEFYPITEKTVLTLDAQFVDEYGGCYGYIRVQVTKDGEEFIDVAEVTDYTYSGEMSSHSIELGAKFAEKGLEYGEYRVALHHQNGYAGCYIVDNLKMLDREYVYPAGDYYIVAAASEDFKVTVEISETPALEEPDDSDYWTPDHSLYVKNMTVIATIAIDGVEQHNTDLELGAFCNGELRGAGRLQEAAGRYECFLLIYGNSGDNITFKLYDHASGSILDLKSNQSLTFEANATIGDVFDPYVINFTNNYWNPDASIYPYRLVSKVGDISTTSYIYDNNNRVVEINNDGMIDYLSYNAQGLLESYVSMSDTNIVSEVNYVYDISNRLISYTEITQNTWWGNEFEYVISYNAEGKVENVIDSYGSVTTYEYNAEGLLIERATGYDYDGEVSYDSKEVYTYQNGKLVKLEYMYYDWNLADGSFTLVEEVVYEYDWNGNCVSEKRYALDDNNVRSLYSTIEYIYNTTVLAEDVYTFEYPHFAFTSNTVKPSSVNVLTKTLSYYSYFDEATGEVVNHSHTYTTYNYDPEIEIPLTIPAAPQNLVATAEGTSITLTWDAVVGAEYYAIYYFEDSTFNYYGSVSNPIGYIHNRVPGVTYCFTVTAINEAGESGPSNEACAMVEEQVSVIDIEVEVLSATSARVIATPNEATAEYIYGIITKEMYDRIGLDSTLYLLHNDGTPLYGVDDWTWDGLKANTEYYVVAHGQNAYGEWGEVTIVEFTTLSLQIPEAPTNLVAEVKSSSEIQLSWDAVEGAEYYNIYSGDVYLGYIAIPVCIVSNVEYGTHCYTVTAFNEAGESEHSNEACATIELPHYWTPDPSLYANNMTVIATIAIDGVEQYNTDLELGAFCNGELRGAERLQETAGNYECFLMVYGDSGDNITFKLYDHASGSILDLKSNQSLTFEANATIGDVFDPYVVNFTNTVVHNQALTSGWNWYSTYIVNEGADGLANLENAIGTSGIQIKNQSKFVNQAGGNWYGTLTSTAVEDMYMIQLSSATNVALEGYEVNPADYPITLGTNWKWISYPVSASISVEEAFASANPSNGDYVKSQTGFAQYYDGLGWSGTLKTMTPGMGYMYQNKSGYAKTLVYPTPSSKGSVKSNVTTDNNHWTADYSKYPMNMTMIAVVEGAESAYEVAAFADGECRGSARPIYVEALDSYIMFMTISGEDNETLTFKYYDVETGETYAIADEFTFSVNATVGDVMNPYVMTRGTLGIDDLSSSINIYPNPVDNELFLATEVRVEEIVIYDVYGRTTTVYGLQTTDFVHSIDVADLEAGVYFVNIKTENGNVVKRFVKK